MKILFSILLAVTFALSINAQTKTIDALQKENESFKKNKCKITYDKFKDVTTIVSSMSPLMGTSITASFNFKGQTLSEPVRFYAVSITTINLMRDASLIFIANNERENIGKAIISNERFKYMGLADLYMHVFEFTPAQLEKFANSEKVEFQIGNLEFATKKDTSEKLKNLLTLSKLK